MPFRKAASGILCVGLLTHASAPLAGDNPPLPVPRPALAISGAQAKAQPHEDGIRAMPLRATSPADPAAKAAYQALLRWESEKNGLPSDIADAVAAIESGYDSSAVGGVGEIGLMQVRPETAAMLGFKGDAAELARPEINIHYGVSYLSQAWRLANGDLCRALMKYRAGHGEEIMSPLSANYCDRARAHLSAAGSPFAAGVSVPIVFEDPLLRAPAAKRGPRLRTEAVSRAFWAAEEARVKAITKRIEAKWRRMASR